MTTVYLRSILNDNDAGEYIDNREFVYHWEDNPYALFPVEVASQLIKRESELKDLNFYSKSDWLCLGQRVSIKDCLDYARNNKGCAYHNGSNQFFRSVIADKEHLERDSVALYHLGEIRSRDVWQIPTVFWGLIESRKSQYLLGAEILDLLLEAKNVCPRLS